MIVENTSTNGLSDKHKIIAYSQTISNFFVDAIDQNDCNVKVLIGFYQELDDTLKSIDELNKSFKPPTKLKDYNLPKDAIKTDKESPDYDDTISSPIDTNEIARQLKQKCFTCSLRLPELKLDYKFDFLFDKLKFQLETYASIQNPLNANMCHIAFVFERQCIPDMIKLLGMVITAYIMMMSLKKLPSFSLGFFIKGVISGLLGQLIASINISMDMSNIGLPCLLAVIEEIAQSYPTNEEMYSKFTPEQKAYIPNLSDYKPLSIYEKDLQEKLRKNEITKEQYTQTLEEYRKENDTVRYYSKELEKQVGEFEKNVSLAFKLVSDTVTECTAEINSYLESIAGLINYFECEISRSGSDFSEVISYVSRVFELLNLLSAIIGTMMRKSININLCKDEKAIKDLSEEGIVPDYVQEGTFTFTNDDMADILTEFTGKQAKLSENGLAILIHDKPVKQTLPKLTLTGCNIREFIEAHKLENVIKATINDLNDKAQNINSTITIPSIKDLTNSYNIGTSVLPVVVPNINIPERDNNSTPLINPIKPIINKETNNVYNKTITDSLYERYMPNIPSNTIAAVKEVIDKLPAKIPNKYTYNFDFNIPKINLNFKPINIYIKYVTDSDKIDKHIDKVISVIETNKKPITGTTSDISKNIDELVDFIYNNPFKPTGDEGDAVLEGITPIINTPDINSLIQDTLQEVQNKVTPSTTECRSIEDVMSILGNLKI